VHDGWLHTGDLGRLTEDGYLILEGRKKELFKTSYGKYVQPAKVEALLRDIPGIAETLLVGEGRPYCWRCCGPSTRTKRLRRQPSARALSDLSHRTLAPGTGEALGGPP
jgi:long-subunit acyl-CoA synthetase (AMP-forming)